MVTRARRSPKTIRVEVQFQVRHPIYGGLVLGSGGLGLVDGNTVVLALSGVLTAVLVGKAAGEEIRLEAHLTEYAAYRTRVRWRIIPWVL